MDALTHAIECYTNRSKETFTDLLARGAIEGIFEWLPRSVAGGDLESRQRMHEYACMAGMAFSNAGLGMVHGISHAFSAFYNTAHGLANAVILPYVLDYNRQDPWVAQELDRLSAALGSDVVEKVRALSREVGTLCASCPSAASSVLMTSSLGMDSSCGARIIFATSALSVLTVPLVSLAASICFA